MDLIPFALDRQSNKIVDIDAVPSGLACNCICPSCKQPLLAKKGHIIKWHFAHQANTDYDEICLYTPARAAKAMILQMLPGMTVFNTPDYIHAATGTTITTASTVKLDRVEISDTEEHLYDATLTVGKHTILLYLGLTGSDKCHEPEQRHSALFIDLSKFVETFYGENRLSGTEQIWRMLALPHPAKSWLSHPKEKSVKLVPQRPEIQTRLSNTSRRWNNITPELPEKAAQNKPVMYLCIHCNHRYKGKERGPNSCPKCHQHLYRKKL